MKPLTRRLLPLYFAAFLQSFVLWYAIEKLFMHHIGYDDAGIGVMVAAYSGVMLILETPAGIWADRWSRKGVLIVGGLALAISSLVGGMSTEPVLYVVCAMLWGGFYAMYTGMYDTIIYDVLLEDTGKADNFERVYSYVGIVESVGLVASALVGGFIGDMWSLPSVYFLTIPIALLSVIALWKFKEPQLHRKHEHAGVMTHIREMFSLMVKSREVLWTIAGLVLVMLTADIVFEFSQLWLIALAVPPFLYGPSFAAVLASTGIGSFIAGQLAIHRRVATKIFLVLMMAAASALIFSRTLWVIVPAQVALGTCAMALYVFYSRDLHDLLPSKFRGGAASAASSVQKMLLIPMGLFLGILSTQIGIFAAGWIGVGLVALVAVAELRPRRKAA